MATGIVSISNTCENPPAAYIVHLNAVRFLEIPIPLEPLAVTPLEPLASTEYSAWVMSVSSEDEV